MSLRILHVLDHSIPLHSGYTFRTLAILRGQRALGWETFHITSRKQGPCTAAEQDVSRFYDLLDVLAYQRHKALIVYSQTGVLFKAGSADALAQALLDLLNNPALWPVLKANGREFVENTRNWKNSVANYVGSYERFV